MEKTIALPEVVQVNDLDFKIYKSKTYGIKVGCGTFFCIIDYNSDGSIHKVRIPRNTKFNCSLITRDSLAKQATFQIRRDPKQLIKDLKGSKAHACEKYNITCKAFSCSDAISKVVDREISAKIL